MSWVTIREQSDFSLQNLPYGVFSTAEGGPIIGVAIGDDVLDLKVLAQDGVFSDLHFDTSTLEDATLNAYAALGRSTHRAVRERLQRLLEKDGQLEEVLRDNLPRRERALVPQADVTMHLPMVIGDYTDFFVGYHHAVNCAALVKPGADIKQICPGFFNIPIGYHGRGSSVVVSGTSFHRPNGAFPVNGTLVSSPCQKLDFEVEFAALISHGNDMGDPISVDEAEDHIFGFVLMNDWSARDIQMYEATVMGPLNGKNFCTTISPWVVPFDAMEPLRTAPKKAGRPLLDYLTQSRVDSAYSLQIQAKLRAGSKTYKAVTCNTNNVIFSFAQMIAHHTRAGCPLRTGDLIATGTLSGPTREEAGCLLEATRGGVVPYELAPEDGSDESLRRAYLEDGDSIEYTAHVKSADGSGNIGFGLLEGTVLAAK